MADLEKLIGLERDLAAGGGEEYRRALSKDAVVIVPGATMGKEETIAAMEESEGWDEFSIDLRACSSSAPAPPPSPTDSPGVVANWTTRRR